MYVDVVLGFVFDVDETFEVLSFIKDGTGDIYTKPSSGESSVPLSTSYL